MRVSGTPMSSRQRSAPDPRAINAVLIAVRQAADVLCDRWTLSVLLLAFAGVSRFSDFRALTGMASRQLTERLRKLEAQEIVVRMPYSRRPLRYGTHLTTMGQSLFDVFACMASWERGFGVSEAEVAVQISHPHCTAAVASPELICVHCQTPVTARDVGELEPGRHELERLPAKATTYRRTATSSAFGAAGLPLSDCIAILGDKWTIEILVIVFMRVGSFVEIQRHSGISSNVLTDRLSRLLEMGMLRQTTAEEGGRAGSYRITDKGIAFYPILLAIQAWADEWLPNRSRSPLRLEHRPCAQPLKLAIGCAACAGRMTAGESRIEIVR